MKIVCIGSFNRDMVYGVDHIAVGGETILSHSLSTYWGGKGLNQAVALARSFDGVYMAGLVNRREEAVCDFLRENNVHSDYVAFSEKPTGHAIICVDKNGQNSITVFGGANQALTPAYVRETLANFEAGDIVLVQNETNQLETILREAHARGLRVAMTPSPFQKALLALPLELVDYFLINEIEGCQLTGEAQPEKIIAAAGKKFPAALVLTLGKAGAMYAAGGAVLQHGTYDVPVVDTTAAGDTFTGYFLSGLARGLGPAQALEQASKASSIAVSRKGATASIPKLEEVLAFDKPESIID